MALVGLHRTGRVALCLIEVTQLVQVRDRVQRQLLFLQGIDRLFQEVFSFWDVTLPPGHCPAQAAEGVRRVTLSVPT